MQESSSRHARQSYLAMSLSLSFLIPRQPNLNGLFWRYQTISPFARVRTLPTKSHLTELYLQSGIPSHDPPQVDGPRYPMKDRLSGIAAGTER